MKKFIVHYHAPAEAMQKMATATAEEKMEGMKAWMDWKEKMGDKVIDFGAPLMPAHRIEQDGSEGQSGSSVTGFSMMQANSIEELKEDLKSHPHLKWIDGVAIEILEHIPMMN